MEQKLDDHKYAIQLATEAGELLLDLRENSGLSGKELGKVADNQSHDYIVTPLRILFPQDAIRSEENSVDPTLAGKGRTWIIDPLDGTKEYTESGRSDWAVHVALVEGDKPIAGAVALPAKSTTFSTYQPHLLAPEANGPLRVVVSRSRPPDWSEALAQELGAELIQLGSAGAKAMEVLSGRADIYVHANGAYEWDSAAPVAVTLAAGLHASRIDGSTLRYNQANPWLPDLLICRAELAEMVLKVISNLVYS